MDDKMTRKIIENIQETTKRVTKSKKSAIEFLKSIGILDKNGKLAKEYGG